MRSDRVAQPSRSPFEGMDLGYASEIWDSASPIDALVLPFIGTDRAFAMLHEIVGSGYDDAEHCHKHGKTAYKNLSADHDRLKEISCNVQATLSSIEDHIIQLEEQDDPNLAEEIATAEARFEDTIKALDKTTQGQHSMTTQLGAIVDFGNKSLELLQNFSVIHKVAIALDTVNTEYGADYKKDRYAVTKLTVCIKCLEAAWGKMRVAYKMMKEADEFLVGALHHFDFSGLEEFEQK